jgi:hypothetical protein
MKISMTTPAEAILVDTAVAAGGLPGWATPIGTPTVHTVASAGSANETGPVGTPTVHGAA